MSLAVCRGLRRLDGGLDDDSQVRPAAGRAGSSGHDPAQVEQVVDQLHLRPRVAVDHLDGPLLPVGVAWASPSFSRLGPAQDRAERRAQLVRQRRQELVLDRVARCAAMRALRSASRISSRCWLASSTASARLRSVRSRVTFAKPTRRPASSRRAVMTTLAQNVRAVLADPPALVLEAASRRRPAARAPASRSSLASAG